MRDESGNDRYHLQRMTFGTAGSVTRIDDRDGKGSVWLNGQLVRGEDLRIVSDTVRQTADGGYTLTKAGNTLYVTMGGQKGHVEILHWQDGDLGISFQGGETPPEPPKPVNHEPVLSSPLADAAGKAGEDFSYVLAAGAFSDPDGDELSYSASLADGSALPSWLSFDAASRTFSGRPGAAGTWEVKVVASDGEFSVSDVFRLSVAAAPVNHEPVLSSPLADAAGKAGEDFSYVLAAGAFSDPDGDELSYSASLADGSALPSWLSFDAASRTFSGRPGAAGTWEVKVVASDGEYSVSDVFRLSVAAAPVNHEPVLSTPLADAAGKAGEDFSYVLAAGAFSDPDGDELSYSASLADGSALPSWLSFDAASRTFSGRPGAAGTWEVKVVASDGEFSVSDVFRLSVAAAPVNHEPVLSSPLADAAGKAGEDFSYVLAAGAFSDPDGDELSYSASLADGSALPSWLSFDAASRTFSGRPGAAGTWEVKVVASDGEYSVSDVFRLSVAAAPVNHEPVLSSPLADAAGKAGEDFSYVLAAGAFSDPDGDELSYSASLADGSALPSWLSFDAASRTFSGRPGAAGTWDVKVVASDGEYSVSDVFTVTVEAGAAASVIRGTNSSDVLKGTAAGEILFGLAGNDTLDPGGGRDLAQGMAGNDNYVFSKGYGHDTLFDNYYEWDGAGSSFAGVDKRYHAGNDTLIMRDLSREQVVMRLSGDDLEIGIKEEGKAFSGLSDVLTIKNWRNPNNRIETIRFTDGDITAQNLTGYLTFGDEGQNFTWTESAADLSLGSGNDTITTGNYGDTVITGSGANKVFTSGGNDSIHVSAGASGSIVQGGVGNDSYSYGRAGGRVSLFDNYSEWDGAESSFAGVDKRYHAGNDTLIMRDLSREQVVMRLSGDDLEIGIKEEGKAFSGLSDVLTIKNWKNANNRIETIQFTDARVTIANLSLETSDMGDSLSWTDSAVRVTGGSGNDTITTGNYGDTVITGSGANKVFTAGGNDSIHVSAGASGSIVQGGVGNDSYSYGRAGGRVSLFDNYSEWDGAESSFAGVDKRYHAGNDTLIMRDLSREQVVMRLSGDDLEIGIKEEGKAFSGLSDVLTIKNWKNANNRIETIQFTDARVTIANLSLETSDMGDSLSWTDSAVRVTGGSGNDVITTGNYGDTVITGSGANKVFTSGGNDSIHVSAGASGSIVQGGVGNDSYSYGRAGGRVSLFDNYSEWDGAESSFAGVDKRYHAGNDTLIMRDLSREQVVMRLSGDDLEIGIKEEGKAFSGLSDVLTIKNWRNANNRIETIRFTDGDITAQNLTGYLTFGDEGQNFTWTESAADLSLGSGNDVITTGNYGDTVITGSGANKVFTAGGNDSIHVSAGASGSIVQGGAGNDSYSYGRAGGRVSLFDNYSEWDGAESSFAGVDKRYHAGNDTLIMRDLSREQVVMRLSGDDLEIGIKEEGKAFSGLSDVLTIKNWRNPNNRIETIRFTDGDITAQNLTGYLTFGDEGQNFTWTESAADLSLGSGNDTITTGNYGDTVITGSGANKVFTAGGNDSIHVSAGASGSIVQGGAGNDSYSYGRAGGRVSLFDNYSEWDGAESSFAGVDKRYHAGNDTLIMRDLSREQVVMRFSEDDLEIGIKEEGKAFSGLSDVLTIKNWKNPNNRIETIQFTDARVTIANLSLETSDMGDSLSWTDSAVRVTGGSGNDTITTGNYGDTVITGSGANKVFTAGGNDSIHVSAGASGSIVQGGAGNDSYSYGRAGGRVSLFDNYSEWDGAESSFAGVDKRYHAGNDTLIMRDLSREQVVMRLSEGDLEIGIKEEGKAFSGLSDVLTIKNWRNPNNRIETIQFTDGDITAQNLSQYLSSDGKALNLSGARDASGSGADAGRAAMLSTDRKAPFVLAEAAEPLKGLQGLGDSGPKGARLCLDSPEAGGSGDAQKAPLHLSGSVFTALSEAGPPADSLFVANATGSALDDRDCILYNTTAGALRHGLDAANAGAAIQLSGADEREKPRVNELFAVC
ncbi:hypothetical protein CAY53_00925 [Desulfobulbus oralis]|uniref:Dystroglycan-type cadherin-like domain-containing protein n=2 Tax=Desulfobulbus oralis TaxID=1986146 RepID=A0A2L1GKM8_9BACT|nr:hypothetical protein CAY53_00925 [Desulfobulbus oralis]